MQSICKGFEKKSTQPMRSESPGWCEGMRVKLRNMVLEPDLPIGRQSRVRPLKRFEAACAAN